MLAYQADDDSLHGTKTVRMEQRTTAQTKELIEKAACLLGINASEFTISAAAKAARDTLNEYEITVLQPSEHAAFMAAMEATEPTNSLVNLMKLHVEVSGTE
jgi:uncharacterized protein (DUF1778 family)